MQKVPVRESLRRLETPHHVSRARTVETAPRKSGSWGGIAAHIRSHFVLRPRVGHRCPSQTHVHTSEGVAALDSLLPQQAMPLAVISPLNLAVSSWARRASPRALLLVKTSVPGSVRMDRSRLSLLGGPLNGLHKDCEVLEAGGEISSWSLIT